MFRPTCFLICSALLCSVAGAQDNADAASAPKPFPAELREQLARVRDAALADDYAYRQVSHLTENIGPRISGSPQSDFAAQYVADQLRELGLDAKLEKVMVPRFVRGAETAQLVAWPGQTPGTTQKIVVTALGNSTATAADGLTAEVVVVRNFDELKRLGRDRVANRIVLFNEKFDVRKAQAGQWGPAYGEAVAYRGDGAKRAAELGAAASLVRSVGGADYRLPHTGWSDKAGIPAGAVTAEDADLIAHLVTQGEVRMRLVLTPQTLPDVPGFNVVADLKGSEHPEQVVVVSGHLDSWDLGTGAIDDAAGVAVAMEAVQILQQLHIRPRRTIRVIAWANEENGGRGSRGYAEAHAAELPNCVAAIESDLGAGHPLGFDTMISAAALKWLVPVQETLSPIGANILEPSNYPPGADIAALGKAGVPLFGILQDGRTYFDYHHTAADTLDKIMPSELHENAAAMTVLALSLASMPDPLPRGR
jgi:hypothetical protein